MNRYHRARDDIIPRASPLISEETRHDLTHRDVELGQESCQFSRRSSDAMRHAKCVPTSRLCRIFTLDVNPLPHNAPSHRASVTSIRQVTTVRALARGKHIGSDMSALAKLIAVGCTITIESFASPGSFTYDRASIHVWDPHNDTDTTATIAVADLDTWLSDLLLDRS